MISPRVAQLLRDSAIAFMGKKKPGAKAPGQHSLVSDVRLVKQQPLSRGL